MLTKVKPANLILLGLYSSVLLLLALIWIQPYVSPDFLLRDTFVLGSIPRYYGLVSNLGIFLWCATAVVTCFSANLLATVKQNSWSKFFLCFSLISFWLALDDFFMLHEQVFISEKKIFLVYVLVVVGSLIHLKNIIIKTNFKILFIGFIFLFTSILIDKIPIFSGSNSLLILEDGTKLLGIVS